MSGFRESLRLWWAPTRIREEGETPDYRFSLANERTFLAWLRTALALAGGGFAVHQFLPDLRWAIRVGIAVTLLAVGALCAVHAVRHWTSCEQAMRNGDDLPISRFPALLSLAVVVVAVLLVVLAVFGLANG